MKIVQANKFLYPNGGADKYCLSLIEELPKSGIEVIPFGMSDPKNIDSSWNKYFSEPIDYHASKQNYLKTAIRLIWNKEAAGKFARLLDESQPDIVHVHNIYHQLSPSILAEAKRRHIPVVMHLHDYKLICPNYLLFSHGKYCQQCLKGNYSHCLSRNCYHSYLRSGLATLESYLHKFWHSYRDNVDLFISPSNFLKDKMVEAGWEGKKIIVLNNPAPNYNPSDGGSRLLYLGRLSDEKGIDVLLQALALTDESLDIVGEGSSEKKLKLLTKKLSLQERVVFHGKLSGEALEKIKREAKAVVVPSVWAENMPLVILESLSLGKIVIASNSGGSPELIEEGKTGFLFPPGDYQALAKKIKDLNSLNAESEAEIAKHIKEKILPLELGKHLQKLESVYSNLINTL